MAVPQRTRAPGRRPARRRLRVVRAHGAAKVVACHLGRLSRRRIGADRVWWETWHPCAAGTALHRRDSAHVRDLGHAGRRAWPARPAAAASAQHRHRALGGAVVGAPAPARQGPRGADPGRLARHRPGGWTGRRSPCGNARHRHDSATRPRGSRDPDSRHTAPDPESHGTRRGPFANGSPDMLPGPRTTRRGPCSRAGNVQSRMECPQAERARKIPHLRTRARHSPPRTRLPRHRRDGHRNVRLALTGTAPA